MKAVLIALLVAACNAPAPGHESTAQNGPPLSGVRRLAMRNCPSSVATARTSSAPTPDGVDVTITSPDPTAVPEILALAQMHVAAGNSLTGIPPHTSMHTGPGSIGFCPIVHANTIITSERVTDGVKIHVHAVDSAAVRELQQATRERVDAVQRPAS